MVVLQQARIISTTVVIVSDPRPAIVYLRQSPNNIIDDWQLCPVLCCMSL